VPITTKVGSSNPVAGEVYSMQHYVIKFVSDLQQVGNFPCVLRSPPPIKLTTTGTVMMARIRILSYLYYLIINTLFVYNM
jgi:hypothetical protein